MNDISKFQASIQKEVKALETYAINGNPAMASIVMHCIKRLSQEIREIKEMQYEDQYK